MKIKFATIFLSALLIIGVIFRIYQIPGHALLFLVSLLGFCILNIISLSDNVHWTNISLANIVLRIAIILTAPILFSKYFYHSFGDYPALVVFPGLIIGFISYLVKVPKKDFNVIITATLYLILIMPIMFVYGYNAPRNYVPREWIQRHNVSLSVPKNLPYKYKSNRTKRIVLDGDDLLESGQYKKAMTKYNEAQMLEPKNPEIFFQKAACYAKMDNLEQAILCLDTAISLDGEKTHQLYTNRGGLYYSLKDFNRAISDFSTAIRLAPSEAPAYFNLALCYLEIKDYEKFCHYIKEAEMRNLSSPEVDELRRRRCQ